MGDERVSNLSELSMNAAWRINSVKEHGSLRALHTIGTSSAGESLRPPVKQLILCFCPDECQWALNGALAVSRYGRSGLR
jgi:hypothetical protein